MAVLAQPVDATATIAIAATQMFITRVAPRYNRRISRGPSAPVEVGRLRAGSSYADLLAR